MSPREEYTAGLRALADLLDATPDLPLPTTRDIQWAVHWYATTDDEKRTVMANIARLIPGRLTKNDPNTGDKYDSDYFRLTGNIGGLPIEIWSQRESVCRRVVTGTREVTELVPADDAPMVEVTTTVEDVEWVCEPLLAQAVTE